MVSFPKILTAILLLFTTSLLAQQDPVFASEGQRSYWFNPASIGTYNSYSANSVFRAIWLNSENPPVSLQVNGALKCLKIGDSENPFSTGAVGLNYRFEKYGLMNTNVISVPINMQFKVSNTYLSVGFSPGVSTVTFDGAWVPPGPDPDPAIVPGTNYSQTKFTSGAGVYWYGENFSVGAASTHLFNEQFDEINYNSMRHYYVSGSYTYPFTDKFALNGTLVGRAVNGFSSVQAMVSGVFGAENELTFGFGFRARDMLMATVTKRFNKMYLGYFIEYGSSQLTNGGWFNHEVRLAFELFDANL